MVGAAIGMFAALVPEAQATLSFDLRLVGGGKTLNSLAPNQQVQLELYAVVTGSNASSTDEGFQNGFLSILSGQGGNVRGNLSGTLESTFAMSGSQGGTSQDLDSDGDSDLGSNATADNTAFVLPRSMMMQTTSGTAIANGREFKLANITFTVTQILNPLDPTPISLFPRVTNFTNPTTVEAVWQEDGVSSSQTLVPGGTFPNSFPTVSAGNSVTLAAIPEPGSVLLLLSSVLALGGRLRRASNVRCREAGF